MKYQDIVDALTEAGMEDAVNVIDQLRAKQRRATLPRRFNGTKRWTKELGDEVRRLHAQTPMTQAQIAARLNVNQWAVNRAIHGMA